MMRMNKVISIAIAFAMVAVSFALVESHGFAFIGNAGGQAIGAWDNGTTLTLNAVFPKLYWIGFNDTAGAVPPWPASRVDTSVAPDADYSFCFEYNYSLDWANCSFLIQAWHDMGGVNGNFPVSPTDAQRTTAFNITCDSSGNAQISDHPTSPDLEITTGPATLVLHHVFVHPTTLLPDATQDTYRVYIPVHLGPQTRAALGALTPGDGFNRIKATALNDPNTWDFSITVRDTMSTASNTSYAEFGVNKAVSVTVSGNPTGNAPPGGNCICAPYTNIVCASNVPYFVNVSLDSALELNGVPSANDIPAGQVRVQNLHPNAGIGSDIAAATPLPGIEPARLYVWAPLGVAIPAPGNGTVTAGPLMSDYWGTDSSTNLEWGVSVPVGRPEGVYWATIVISIED